MVTVSLAALKEREDSLKDTVDSLIDQVDKLNVFLHGFTEIPEFLKNEKIEVKMGFTEDSKSVIGDLGKLAFEVEDGYSLYCDDDLIYPPDYVEKMKEAIDEYEGKCIISFMGSIPFKPPIGHYYTDRMKYSLFETLSNDYEVLLPGTGVMGCRASLMKNFGIEDKEPNMADIHIGIYAKENGIPVIVRNHDKDWVRHSLKINFAGTIYEKHKNNCLVQTELINKHFSEKKVFDESMPKVSIVVINSRQLKNPDYLSECFNSLRDQIYPNVEIVVVKNYDKLVTIGKAWNDAIKQCRGDYILFVGDDDYISPDYVLCLVQGIENSDASHLTTYCTNFSVNGTEVKYTPKKIIPTGMWKKEYLLENPPCEFLTKYVDVDMINRLKENKSEKQVVLDWHYGYFYRSHEGQVSGQKLV